MGELPKTDNPEREIEESGDGQEQVSRDHDVGAHALEVAHPELYKEMVENNVPLEPREFKEKGYNFIKRDDGYHVAYPTQEYQEWLGKPENQRGNHPIKHHEELDERKEREERIEKLEKALEGKSLTTKSAVDLAYDTFYPYGIDGASDIIVKRNILNGLYGVSRKYEYHYGDVFAENYVQAYTKAFKKDKTIVRDEDIVKQIEKRINADYFYPGNYFVKEAKRVARPLIKMMYDRHVPHALEKMSKKDIREKVREEATLIALERGEFFPKTFAENPDSIDQVFKELGVDAHSDEVTAAALFGYGDQEELGAEAKYFDLENKVAEMIDKGRRSGLYCHTGLFKGEIDYKYHGDEITLNGKIAQKALDKIRDAENGLVEGLNGSPEFEKMISEVRKNKVEKEKKDLLRDVANWNSINYRKDFDFGHYLDVRAIGISHADAIESLVRKKVSERGGLGYYMNEHAMCERLSVPDVEMAVNYRDTIREGLRKRLEKGVEEVDVWSEWSTYYGHRVDSHKETAYLTDIFETKNFKDNQERLGIDFKDPEIFKKAFSGFIKTLKSKNGETSDQADWYYEKIFSHHPSQFETLINMHYGQAGRGLKQKITRFKNNCEAFQEYQRLREVDKRLERSGRVIRRPANLADIKQMVEGRKAELLKLVRNFGSEDVSTFSGVKTIPGITQTQHGRRLEAPVDFGVEKVQNLIAIYNYMKTNFPASLASSQGGDNKDWFVDSFVKVNSSNQKKGEIASGKPIDDDSEEIDDNSEAKTAVSDKNSYVGFTFKFNNRYCTLLESFDNDSALYAFACEKPDEYKSLLNYSKNDASKMFDPRIAQIRHFDVQNTDESIVDAMKRALMFFETGQNNSVLYGTWGNKQQFEGALNRMEPAGPFGVGENLQNYPQGISDYNDWARRNAEINRRLNDAEKRGGSDEREREQRRIDNEAYEESLRNMPEAEA